MEREIDKCEKQINCGPYTLDYTNKTLVMGILNVTPDSFSDGGKFQEVEKAIKQAKQMVVDGAHIIDVGGESTRPGATPVTVEEELARVIPVIEALTKELAVPISIDTYRSEVAERAIQAGAHIINDVWGAKADRRIAQVAATYGVPIILMHNRNDRNYTCFFRDVVNDLFDSIQIVKEAGVKDSQIIVDPGVGFAKDHAENLEIMRRLKDIVAIGYPVLLGTSRKSMIGNILELPPEERLEGSLATVCYGVEKGCQIVRVHDVKETSRVLRVVDALTGIGVKNNG